MTEKHEFYEQPISPHSSLAYGWHRYPDGYTVGLTVRVGYAARMASFYASCGKPASAHDGAPHGKVHVERF